MKVKGLLNKLKPLEYNWEYTTSLDGYPTDLEVLSKNKYNPDIFIGVKWRNLFSSKNDVVTNEEILNLDISYIYIKCSELGIPEYTTFVGEDAPGITLYDDRGGYNKSNESQLQYFDKAFYWCTHPFEAKLDIAQGYLDECKLFNDNIFPYLKSLSINKYKETFLFNKDGYQTMIPFFIVGPEKTYSLFNMMVEYNIWTRHLQIDCTKYDINGLRDTEDDKYDMVDICHVYDFKPAIAKYYLYKENVEDIKDIPNLIQKYSENG